MAASYLEFNLPWEWKRHLSARIDTQHLSRACYNAMQIVRMLDPDVAAYATAHLAQELSDVPHGRHKFTSVTSRREWLSHHAAALGLPRPFLEFGSSPAAAVRNAYCLACVATASSEPYEAVSAFGVIACVVDSLSLQRQCSLCPRLAPPGRDRCEKHTQPKVTIANQHNQVARAAEIARRVKARYGGSWMQLCAPRFDEILFGILWPRFTPGLVVDTWSATIDEVLWQSPHVSDQLPEDFAECTFEEKLNTLRLTLDPNGVSVLDWPVKIAVLDTWLEMEYEATPRPRTMTLKNRLLCQRAIRLLSAGMAQVDVARRLEMDGSYLGRLIRTFQRMQSEAEGEIRHPRLANSESEWGRSWSH